MKHSFDITRLDIKQNEWRRKRGVYKIYKKNQVYCYTHLMHIPYSEDVSMNFESKQF